MATATGTTPRRTRTTRSATATGVRRLPRSTGALSGLLVVLLGIWGALIPFVGPYFHYAFGSYQTWHFTTARLWLEIVPGAVAVLGGLMLLTGARRSEGILGGWLAIAAGIWFAIGPVVALLWHHAPNPIGAPMGGHTRQMLELIGYFHGLGVAIVGLAAFAMGRYFSRPRIAEDAVAAGAAAPVARRPVAREPVARDARAGTAAPAAAETRAMPADTADETRAAPAATETSATETGSAAEAPPPRRRFGLFGRRRSAA